MGWQMVPKLYSLVIAFVTNLNLLKLTNIIMAR
jgi:hypothetical protein